MCQNTTMRVNGAWIKRYCVLCSKTYNILHSCHNFPAGLRQTARGAPLLWNESNDLIELKNTYHQFSNTRHHKSQNFNISHLVLQLSLCNILKPGVKSRNEDVVGAMLTGDASTTYEWSTILLPTEAQIIEVLQHYNNVIMSVMAFQITSLTIFYSTIYSRCRSNKASKLCVNGLCAGNSPVTGEFHAQRASNAENVSIWSCHHDVSSLVHHWFRYWLVVSLESIYHYSRFLLENISWNLI